MERSSILPKSEDPYNHQVPGISSGRHRLKKKANAARKYVTTLDARRADRLIISKKPGPLQLIAIKVAHLVYVKQNLRYLVSRLLLAASVTWLSTGCHRQVYVQTSVAMEPTIKPGDRVKVDTAAYKHSVPARWDIIIFRFPEGRNTLATMRVVGLPGETIEVEEDGIVVNGAPLAPPASMRGIRYRPVSSVNPNVRYPLAIPEKSCFVLGDNSSHARDSRFWGPLSVNEIVGKVFGR